MRIFAATSCRLRVGGRAVVTAVGLALAAPACRDSPSPVNELEGVFDYTAMGVVSCTEEGITSTPPYKCNCGPPQQYIGVLDLRADGDRLAGTLRVRLCLGPNACSEFEQSVDVVADGQRVTADSAFFFLGVSSINPGQSGWYHRATWRQGSITGRHHRFDGGPRGCGDDDGVFTAVRR